MNNICMLSLPDKDSATLERVIHFCSSRGQNIQVSDADNASIVICADDPASLTAASQITDPARLIVVSNDRECSLGDYQLTRPLLVTRVMRIMETVLNDDSPLSVPEISAPESTEPAIEVDQNSPHLTDSQAPVEDHVAIIDPAITTVEASEPVADVAMQYHALVVDDSAPIRKQLEIELKSTGIYCDFAESGEQALEKIVDTTYDLIFLDIMMPGIDGYEACGHIRKDARYKRTPVVMLSGKTSPMDEVEGVIAGASTYLTKPLIPEQFQQVMTRIKRWLSEFR